MSEILEQMLAIAAEAAVVVKVEAVYDAMWGPSAGKLIV